MLVIKLALVLFSCPVALGQYSWSRTDFLDLSIVFFKARQVKSVTTISCYEEDENYWLMKSYLEDGFYVQIVSSLGEFNVSGQSNCGVVVDARCESVMEEIVANPNINEFMVTNIFWLFLDTIPLSLRMPEQFYDFSVPEEMKQLYNRRFRAIDALPMSHVSVGVFVSSWKLFAIHKPYPQAALIWNEINWFDRNLTTLENMQHALRCLDDSHKGKRNLQGYAMPAAVVITMPEVFSGIEDHTDVIHDLFSKANYPFIKTLMHDLNFTLNLRQVDKGGWQVNGTFTGIMGLFQKRDIELGVLGALMRTERMEVVDYTAVTLVIKTNIIFKQPPLSVVSNVFELPFSTGVWFSCLGFVIIYWISLVLFRVITKTEPFTVLESMSYIIGTLCQQNSELLPLFNGTKLLFFFSHVVSFFIVTTYSASIVALLQSPNPAITSVQDLTKSPLKVGSMDTFYVAKYFNETSDPIVRDLFLKKIKPEGKNAFTEAEVGLRRVKDELYAFQVEANAAYQLIKETFTPQDTCKIYELDSIKLPPLSIPMVKRSKYRELFRQRLARLREVGIVRRYNLIWVAEKPRCVSGMAGFNSVGLNETRYVYILVLAGCVIAVILLVGEIMWNRIQLRWKQKDSVHIALYSEEINVHFVYLD